jgi:hypothetical protein
MTDEQITPTTREIFDAKSSPKTATKHSRAPATITEAIPVSCPTCTARFASPTDLHVHVSIKTTHGPCISLSTMFSTGWHSKHGIWSAPPKPQANRRGRPPKAVDPESIHTCVMCQESFATAEAFNAHYVPISADPSELAPGRLDKQPCLDTDELRALEFGRTVTGIWKIEPWTLKRLADVLRLASVRAPLFSSRDARFWGSI